MSENICKLFLVHEIHLSVIYLLPLPPPLPPTESESVMYILITARKQSLGLGNIFTPVCQSFVLFPGMVGKYQGVTIHSGGSYASHMRAIRYHFVYRSYILANRVVRVLDSFN